MKTSLRDHFETTDWVWIIWIPLVSLILDLCATGNESTAATIFAALGNLLVLPGFIILTFARVIFRVGNLHGDNWDFLAAPLSMVFNAWVIYHFRRRSLERSSNTE
jgi:hypothetical protein